MRMDPAVGAVDRDKLCLLNETTLELEILARMAVGIGSALLALGIGSMEVAGAPEERESLPAKGGRWT